MINVWIPAQKEFGIFRKECKNLYERVQDKITDKNTFFYLFESEGDLIGAIYYFTDKNGKLFLNAFAKRKKHELNLKCLKMSLNWFRGRVYAVAQNRASALCLLRCGFVRVKDKLFVKEQNL